MSDSNPTTIPNPEVPANAANHTNSLSITATNISLPITSESATTTPPSEPSSTSNSSTSTSISSSPVTKPTYTILIPPVSAAEDPTLITHLIKIINAVYEIAEAGIFNTGYARTNALEVKSQLLASKLALASISSTSPLSPVTNIVGTIRIVRHSPILAGFGTLVSVPSTRQTGLGKLLVEYAENWAMGWGAQEMQLELLVPLDFKHELKIWIQKWYERMGYNVVEVRDFRKDYEVLGRLVKGGSEYRVFRKVL